MDAKTYLEATTAAQALMSTHATIGVDGKWGSFTQKVYDALPGQLKLRVDALIRAVAPGQSASTLAAHRQREKQIGALPAAVVVGAQGWASTKAALLKTAANRGYANPSLVVAQAAHESGNGASQLAQKYNNYGGLKKGVKSPRSAGVINFSTIEGYGSTRSTIRDDFHRYNSAQDWIEDELDYLERKTRGRIKQAKTAKEYNDLLRAFGYYTADPSVYLAALEQGTRAV